jgi:hypothetical protein
VNFRPVDGFTQISPGLVAIHKRLKQYPRLLANPINPIRQAVVPIVFKERDTPERIFNQILLAHFPGLIPPDVIRDVLHTFCIMMKARKTGKWIHKNRHKDTRSRLISKPLHLGIWRKKANPLALTGDTRAGGSYLWKATSAFLREIEKITIILAPIMEKLCPRLMERQHRYHFSYYCYYIFQP